MNTRRNFALALLGGATAASLVKAQTASSSLEIPIGTVAGHSIGRAIISPDGTVEVIAYYPFFSGLSLGSTPLLASGSTERGAFFTLRTGKFTVRPITNGSVHYSQVIPVGAETLISRITYHPSPNLDFNRPESFSDGQTILTLRGRGGSLVMVEGATITYNSTAEVVSTEDFSFQGRKLNLRDTRASAFTVTLAGPAPNLSELDRLESAISVPVAGSFVAAGARLE